MTRPRKNPGASGIRTRDLPLSRRTPYQYLEGSEGMLPWNILKVETKICAIGGILGANLKKSGTLKFIMNISFLPSVCIYRSIILTFAEKSMFVDCSPTESILFQDFRCSFPRESSFPRRIPGSGPRSDPWLSGRTQYH